MADSQTDPHNQTWEIKQRRNNTISPNKPSQCSWESIGESLNKQNKLPFRFTRLYEHPPVRLYAPKGTIDAAIEIKEFVKEGLAAGEILILISLDVKGAFGAAWWSFL